MQDALKVNQNIHRGTGADGFFPIKLNPHMSLATGFGTDLDINMVLRLATNLCQEALEFTLLCIFTAHGTHFTRFWVEEKLLAQNFFWRVKRSKKRGS